MQETLSDSGNRPKHRKVMRKWPEAPEWPFMRMRSKKHA